MQLRFDRTRRRADQRGRFLGVISFDVAKHQNDTVIFRQTIDRLAYEITDFAAFKQTLEGHVCYGKCWTTIGLIPR